MNRIVLILALMFTPFSLSAWDDSPECVKDIESHFFNQTWLFEAMSYHYVSQSLWQMIYHDIQYRSQFIHDQVKVQRERADRDPFQNPFDGPASWQLVRSVLFQNFKEVMYFYQITSESDIVDIFDFLETKQKARIISCFKLEEKPAVKK